MESITEKRIMLRGINAVAKYYKCSSKTVQGWVNNKTVPFLRIGNGYRFYVDEIDAVIRANKVKNTKDENENDQQHI